MNPAPTVYILVEETEAFGKLEKVFCRSPVLYFISLR